MSDSSSKGDQARAEILDAARRLFLSQGYHGTSMRAIAQEAGNRAVAGLYNHFPTKEAIFQALITERNPYNTLFDLLEGTLDQVSTAPDFVHAALREIMHVMPQYFDFFQLVEIDLREFNGENIGRLLLNIGFPRVLSLFARLQSLPGLKPSLNPVVIMRIMASLMIGYIITDQIVSVGLFHQLTTDEWADQFANVLLYGFAAGDAGGGVAGGSPP